MATWILLRGLMREARHWGSFPAQLAAALPQARIMTPDFPGNGRLHQQASCRSVPQMVEFLRAHLQAQGHPPPYHILALSLGAMAGVAWAQNYPQEVSRLILLNTSLRPYNPFWQRLRVANYHRLLGLLLRPQPAHRESLIFDLTSNLCHEREEMLQRWQTYANQHPVTRSNILRQLLAAARFHAAAHAPNVPILMLAGRHDRLVSAQCSQTLAKRWACPLHLHPSAGHDLPLDDANWVIARLQDWLASKAA